MRTAQAAKVRGLRAFLGRSIRAVSVIFFHALRTPLVGQETLL
jgi:hypothetical protein